MRVRRNADTRLRDLERRWEQTRSPGDAAAYLNAVKRAGDQAAVFRAGMHVGVLHPAKLWVLARMGAKERAAIEAAFGESIHLVPWRGLKKSVKHGVDPTGPPQALDRGGFTRLLVQDIARESRVRLSVPRERIIQRWLMVEALFKALIAAMEAQGVGAAEAQVRLIQAQNRLIWIAGIELADGSVQEPDNYQVASDFVARATLFLDQLPEAGWALFEAGAFPEVHELPRRWLEEARPDEWDDVDEDELEEIVRDRARPGEWWSWRPEQVDIVWGDGACYGRGYPDEQTTYRILSEYLTQALLAYLRDEPPPAPPQRATVPDERPGHPSHRHRNPRHNPLDPRLRDLERRAAAGDPEALARLASVQARAAPIETALTRYVASRAQFAPDNVAWVSAYRDSWGEVPFSELAMHTQDAGRKVKQYALFPFFYGAQVPPHVSGAAVLVEYTEPLGKPPRQGVLAGLAREVLPQEVQHGLRNTTPGVGYGALCMPVTENPPRGDEQLRRLERKVLAGDLEAHAPYRIARLRAGLSQWYDQYEVGGPGVPCRLLDTEHNLDFYHCPGSLGGSLIARRGHGGPQYWSSPVGMLPALSTSSSKTALAALRIARRHGLLPPDQDQNPRPTGDARLVQAHREFLLAPSPDTLRRYQEERRREGLPWSVMSGPAVARAVVAAWPKTKQGRPKVLVSRAEAWEVEKAYWRALAEQNQEEVILEAPRLLIWKTGPVPASYEGREATSVEWHGSTPNRALHGRLDDPKDNWHFSPGRQRVTASANELYRLARRALDPRQRNNPRVQHNGPGRTPPPCDPANTTHGPVDTRGLRGEPVRVHVNLHNGCFVVSHRGHVAGYAKTLALKNVIPKVSLAGWERCNTSKVRNVHAYLTGDLSVGAKKGRGWRQITYNCKIAGPSFHHDDGTPFEGAAEAVFTRRGAKGEVWVRGAPPPKRNPDCGCRLPGGGCRCGAVQAWWREVPPGCGQ